MRHTVTTGTLANAHQPDSVAAPVFALPDDMSAALGVDHIRTVFQPIIDIEAGGIVAFEALTRGPAGSRLENPLDLLGAASEAGYLGELDWVCRAAAVSAALASSLPASVTWFINVEPYALLTPCPSPLFSLFRRASRRLRLMWEVTERSCEFYQTELIQLAAMAKRNRWGIALDDVGVNEASLGLLSLLEPDVVKLDQSLLDPTNALTAMNVLTAINRHNHSHWPPRLLAEGIENVAQFQTARSSFGIRYAQGFHYGHPGPLPPRIIAPTEPVPIRSRRR